MVMEALVAFVRMGFYMFPGLGFFGCIFQVHCFWFLFACLLKFQILWNKLDFTTEH